MNSRFWISPLAMLALAACSDVPTVPGTGDALFAVVHREVTPLTAEWSGCTELLTVEGWQRDFVSQTATPSGKTTTTFHYQKSGTAVGALSGRRYVFNESSNFMITGSGNASTFTAPMSVKLIGQGDAPDMLVRWIAHVTVNANGEVTSTVSDGTWECRA